ncbi:MAG: cyclophilin-like fold protein, partial [Desulfovibrionaceae bacterium]|nr:cyclophilin-like fold protein [Desulfovibrionaceae bacterium]
MKLNRLFAAATLACALVLLPQTVRAESAQSARVIENGTPVTLTIGKTVIPATLNDSRTARALIARLPYTVKLHRYSHDYCGVMEDPLPYNEADVH